MMSRACLYLLHKNEPFYMSAKVYGLSESLTEMLEGVQTIDMFQVPHNLLATMEATSIMNTLARPLDLEKKNAPRSRGLRDLSP